MTQKKVVDERIVHEVGQVYRIAYYLFNAVVGLDLMIKSCVDRIPSGMAGFQYIGFEFIAFVVVNLVAMVMLWRKGLMDDEARYAEADAFPWKHYLLESVAAGVGIGLISCVLRALRGEGSPLAYGVMLVSFVVCMVVCVMPAAYLSFRIAKRRRAQIYDSDDAQ